MDSKTSRRNLLTRAATGPGRPADSRRRRISSGSKKPIVGEGEHTLRGHTRLGASSPRGSNTAIPTAVCEAHHGHIYIHHTVFSTSEKPDSMVVFVTRANLSKAGARILRRCARLYIRKEGKQEFLYLLRYKARPHGEDHPLSGEEVFTARLSEGVGAVFKAQMPRANRSVQPNEPCCRAEWRYLHRRRLRIELHQPYDNQGKYIRTFGGPVEAGQLSCPHGIIVDTRPKRTGFW